MATQEHAPHVVSLSAEEIVEALQIELKAILKLRDENHYRNGRPDQQNDDDKQEEYDFTHSVYDDAWASWADATYKNNNRMGSHIATAQKLAAALHKWIMALDESEA